MEDEGNWEERSDGEEEEEEEKEMVRGGASTGKMLCYD